MYVPIEPGISGARRARARHALIVQLKRANAYRLDQAIEVVTSDRMEERMLKRLVDREVLKPGLRGGYWLDLERYRDCRRQELIFAIGAILVTAGVVACALLYAKPHHHGRVETQVVFPFP
jgi:hypothetical protein